MKISNFEELVEVARSKGPTRVAVAAAHDPEVLLSMDKASKLGLATGYLIGDWSVIEALVAQHGLDISQMTVIHEPDVVRAARQAVALVREGRADAVVKGQLHTDIFLKAVLDKEFGLRDRKLLSHVCIFQVPGMERLIFLSDAGVVLYPTILQKLEIIQGAVDVARRLGLECPKVALLAATEVVHPNIPASFEALALARMAEQGWIEGAIVDGPLALDTALSAEAARIKGIKSPVAGQADILIMPDIESGNIAVKSLLYFVHARMAGLVIGARAPLVVNSRADSAENRFLSLAMAVFLATE
ncbi:MAG: bifunctional enoyl-CoA hydratase/phosphate acetyltransferase [Anaerolineae bacterium]